MKSLFKIGSRFRNPHLSSNLAFLKASESWSIDQLKAYQLKRCRELLLFANEHSSFYRNRLNLLGFDVNQFADLDQLQQIQPVTKGDLIARNSSIHTTKSHYFKKTFFSETSGSTGEPLSFMKDEEWDSWVRASVFRGLNWHGVDPWEPSGYFWGYDLGFGRSLKTRLLDIFQSRFRCFSYDQSELVGFIRKLEGASYLHGYSSMIYEVSRIINQNKIDTSRLNLKLIKGTSEKIYDHYQDEVERAFGKRIVSEYGAAESGVIAFECPHGAMHLNMEGCIVEVEDGEIIVTNLNSFSFPVIRYRLGDYVRLEDESFVCPCGMEHPVLREVTGRVGSRVFGVMKTYPSLIFYYVYKNVYLRTGHALDVQFVQQKKGCLVVRSEGDLTLEERTLIDDQMTSYFGGDLKWVYASGEVIHDKLGKRRDFVSHVKG